MKPLFLFLGFIVSTHLFSQDHTLYITDSLIRINKVKSRIKTIPGARHSSQIKEEFSKKGLLIKSVVFHPFTQTPIIEIRYFYDSLDRLYASRSTNRAMSYSRNYLLDAYGNEVPYVTSYYQYDKENKLRRSYTLDSAGKVNFESLYSYNPKVIDKRWYDNQIMWKHAVDSFERNIFVTCMHLKTFDLDNNILTEFKYLFNNSFDPSGKLKETVFQSERCSSVITYDYLENGLIKKKNGDNCHHPWQYSYKYYK